MMWKYFENQLLVIKNASSELYHALVREFAKHWAKLASIAKGKDCLEATRQKVLRIITMKYYYLKMLCSVIFTFILTGCSQTNNKDALDKAAIHFSGVFITQYLITSPSLRVKGQTVVGHSGDSIFHVKGTLEGFTSFNVPVSIKRFSETLRYSGGDPNKPESWQCIEINVDDKKMK